MNINNAWAPHGSRIPRVRPIVVVPFCQADTVDWLRHIGEVAGWGSDQLDMMRSHMLIESARGESSTNGYGALLQVACGDKERNRSLVWTMRHADERGIVDRVVWVADMPNVSGSTERNGAYQVIDWESVKREADK